MTCSTCKYWHPNQREEARDKGQCRRFPPQITTRIYTLGPSEHAGRSHPEVESSTETEWPETDKAEGCGEYIYTGLPRKWLPQRTP